MTADVSSAGDMTSDHILVGKVIKPHGIKGEIKVFPYSRTPANFKVYREVLLAGKSEGDARHFTIRSCRVQGGAVILKLDGVETRSAAEVYSGFGVWVAKIALAEPAPDEFYWHEMVGARVFVGDGRELGSVSSIFETKAHDVLVVKGGGKEYLIPILENLLRDWDRAARTLVIDVPPGLLEIND